MNTATMPKLRAKSATSTATYATAVNPKWLARSRTPQHTSTTTQTHQTKEGTRKGKIPYMSPEQCMGGDVDHRSDIFSLGILLYEMTTMTRLFKAKTEMDVIDMVANARVPPPTSRVPKYPPALEAIVMKTLHKEPPSAPPERPRTARRPRTSRVGMAAVGLATKSTRADEEGRLSVRAQRPAQLAACRPRPGGIEQPLAPRTDVQPRPFDPGVGHREEIVARRHSRTAVHHRGSRIRAP